MRHKRRVAVAIVVCMVGSCLSTAWGQQDALYPIQLHRKTKQGDHALVEIILGRNTRLTTTWQGSSKPVISESAYVIHLIADVKFLKVDDFGDSVKERFNVISLRQLKDDGTAETELVPPKSIIIAEGGPTETSFTLDGNPVTAELKSTLSRFIVLHETIRPADLDAIFGTNEQKRVGDKWSGDVKALLQRVQRLGDVTSVDQLAAESQLVAMETYDGVPCMKMHFHAELKEFTPPRPPPDTQPKHASSVSDEDKWLPLGVNQMSPRFIQSTVTHYQLEGVSRGRHYSTEQTTASEAQFRLLQQAP